ncbi:response regulator transcription factor [Burkholderia sp. L27(2015)]|uniref:response regulator n=1 Tax=Burkholderia sp. L27(2015) TaxID=1641858 RepID=UPI00131AAF3F|nr:response regulator transcription factor [Burkholderia sp. L27(2015)]
MIKILIADDHAIMREGLKQLFALEKGISVVAEAANGNEVFEALRRVEVDLVLLDMSMSGISGANLINRIHLQQDSPRILVLSMHCEAQVARYALNAGASGYLTKDNDPKTLIAAIFKVVSGGRFIDPRLAESLIFDHQERVERPLHELLSIREFEIFDKLVRGRSVNEIADELSISNKTVSTHKVRLMQKMNCQNNAQLIRYAVSYHLVE